MTDRTLEVAERGSRQRILSVLAAYQRLGWHVSLLAPGPIADVFIAECDHVGCVSAPCYHRGDVTLFDPSPWFPAVRAMARRRRLSAVVAEYAWMGPCLRFAPPGAVRIIDTHDVFHARAESFRADGRDPWVHCSAETEARLLRFADVVFAIQDREAEQLRKLLGDTPVVACVHHGVRLGRAFTYRRSRGSGLMFVGTDHDGNLGIRDFLAFAWPAVRNYAGARLDVYGAIGRRLAPARGVTLHGVVEDLSRGYERSALAICPLTAGSGSKIKLLEALAHGRSAVVTPRAIDGMPKPEEAVWAVARDWAEFGRLTLELLRDESRRHALEAAAQRYARHFFSEERLMAALRRAGQEHCEGA